MRRSQGKELAILACLVTAAGSVGCGGNRGDSHLAHTAGEPVRQTESWQWQSVEGDDFEDVYLRFLSAAIGQPKMEFLADKHPVAQAAQRWVDRFDQNLRERYPVKMKNTPKPEAVIKFDLSPNAMVLPVPVCLNVPVNFERKGAAINHVALRANGSIAPMFQGKAVCIERDVDYAEARSFASWYNSTTTSCAIKVMGEKSDFSFGIAQGCHFNKSSKAAGSAERLVYLPTADKVVVHVSMFNGFEEEDFSAVIAHELGHYYRAHTTVDQSGPDYNFFYTIGERNLAEKPAPEASLHAIGEKLRSTKLPKFNYHRFDGQKIYAELYLPASIMANVVGLSQDCSTGECNEVCSEFSELFAFANSENLLGGYPLQPLAKGGEAVVSGMEHRILACLDNVDVTGQGVSSTGTSISPEFVLRALAIDPSLFPAYAGMKLEGNAAALLGQLEEALKNADKARTDLFAEAVDRRIGFYTLEQEADELAAEWMADVGVDPYKAVETEIKLAQLYEGGPNSASEFPHTVGWEQCLKLYVNDWRNDDGEPVFVPVADYLDPHHSACFRAFNLSREIEAHQLEAKGRGPVDQKSWESATHLATTVMKTWLDERTVKKSSRQKNAPLVFKDFGETQFVAGEIASHLFSACKLAPQPHQQ